MARIRTLTGTIEQTRGVIGRYPASDELFVFCFDEVRQRRVHMLGVWRPLRVEWWADEELQAAETLRPWIGTARHPADRIVERRP